MTLEETVSLTLKKITWLAQTIQSDIEKFQPDMLLVLARGGFAPLWALQALWEETNETNIPPIVITNLGREKITRYEYHREKIGMNFMAGLEPFDYFEPLERGYFLVWLEQQTDWRDELRGQVEACLGSGGKPGRILVIDDTVFKRYTTLIALGLLLAEFPDAKVQMIAADIPHWREELAAPWLAAHSSESTDATKFEIKTCTFNFATGTSDVHPDSLHWEPLNLESYVMQEYLKYLPAKTWLGLGSWMKEQIQSFVYHYTKQEVLTEEEDLIKQCCIQRPCLEPEELGFRQRWILADLAPELVSKELEMSVDSAKRLLQRLSERNVQETKKL